MTQTQAPAPGTARDVNRELQGQVAFVTGGATGIGLAVSRALAARGAAVAIFARNAARAEAAAEAIRAGGGQAHAFAADVTTSSAVDAAFEQALAQLGRVDILVNNAGLTRDGLFVRMSDEQWNEVLDTNLAGAFRCSRAVARSMMKARYGRIVNVSSGAGQLATMSTYAPAYSMSKTALNALTRLLAHTYRGKGVLVNAVDPGWVRTDMGGPSAPRSPREGADTIVWLATLPDDGPSGGFFRDRRAIEW